MSRPAIAPVLDFLTVATPAAWLDKAVSELPTLLVDHANCEKKAAGTALSLMYRYVERAPLLKTMSRLAREELRHFEQVVDLMTRLDVPYVTLDASRYAGALHGLVRGGEPARLVDVLILGAVVEARSCERFAQLARVLPEPVADLYRRLLDSEARHFQSYLRLARTIADQDIEHRIAAFLAEDARLVCEPDAQFRFHSGAPG